MNGNEIKIVRDTVSRAELQEMAKGMFGNLVKAVVDIDQKIMGVGGELHADEEQALLELGSSQSSLWGINIYPEESADKFIEFDSMINLRPSQGNRSRGVDDPATREKIIEIVYKLVVS